MAYQPTCPTAAVQRPQTSTGPGNDSPLPPVPSKDINRSKHKMSFSEHKAQQVPGSTSSDCDTVKIRPSKVTPIGDNENGNINTNQDQDQDQDQNINRIMRDIKRPPPGDVTVATGPKHSEQKLSSSSCSFSKQTSVAELNRQKSTLNFWESAFSVNEVSPAKERIRGDALVMAEVKTNVIISDEFTFITELTYHLSSRYKRPVSSIVVTLHHGACMLFGGTFDPAYVVSVSTLPSHLQSTTNKRNAALIQKHMEEAIGVSPARGLLKFIPVAEDCLANGGMTVSGEMEMAEKGVVFGSAGSDGVPLSKTITPGAGAEESGSILLSKKSRGRLKLDVKKSLANFRQATTAPEPEPADLCRTQQTQTKAQTRSHDSHRQRHGQLTPPTSAEDSLLPVPERLSSHCSPQRSGGNLPTTDTQGNFGYPSAPTTSRLAKANNPDPQQQHQQPKKRKSFVSTIFSRPGSRAERREDGRNTVLPTIMSERSL
ncbi:hypothetical protein GE21DRAFT_4698 [Neurospora crassa]|uniref:L-dopachrome isomerase n=1 Tax=Neurospora crassa (strain ATCC 24698 / 74-OR23-1A / CBS 708.71 / DSM 1257 / FGSC 987) TaxID=367110 RepID=Q7RYS9_NEUCR|nr:hypothetical protein NCU00380 [Neurospora crassa OR74A]EAA28030.2 hypothetical protein NCU00380 [Neurospora crassa OR74A]KHE87850.1 hypothetical protein GE21DRAFT_4698 [Neurospora crassa]|eukprot:XP_957266.2 hypothetical protein NCU00380 [Neurospora crassa OR74A]